MAHARGKRKTEQVTITGWAYVGGGDYLPSIPARDLTVDEYSKHKRVIEANAKATGRPLYVPLTEESKEEEGED